jgi:hypothetical protein
MDESEKQLHRQTLLATCLGVVLVASSSGYHFWPCVLAGLTLLVGLRHARAMATGVAPGAALSAVLAAALVVLSGTVVVSGVWASLLWFGMGAHDVLTGHRRLGDFLPWLGGRLFLAVLIAAVAVVVLRRRAPRVADQSGDTPGMNLTGK